MADAKELGSGKERKEKKDKKDKDKKKKWVPNPNPKPYTPGLQAPPPSQREHTRSLQPAVCSLGGLTLAACPGIQWSPPPPPLPPSLAGTRSPSPKARRMTRLRPTAATQAAVSRASRCCAPCTLAPGRSCCTRSPAARPPFCQAGGARAISPAGLGHCVRAGGGDEDEEEDASEEDEVVWMTDTSEAAMRKRAEEQLSAATAALVTQVCGAAGLQLLAVQRVAMSAVQCGAWLCHWL